MSLSKSKTSDDKTIILTGGGSAGHVTPNLALIEQLQRESWHIEYLGSHNGIERQLIEPLGLPYHVIAVGKLRRYFSWRNFIDPFKVIKGIVSSYFLCQKIKPQLVFSKGGFVALPVVVAAWMSRIPVIIHESDLTPGLANRLCFPFAEKICLTFTETKNYIKETKKCEITGTPIRQNLLQGEKESGLQFAQLTEEKPVLLIICGSLGSQKINSVVREALPKLLEKFAVIHLCGKGNIEEQLTNKPDYRQYEYLNQELGDVLACSDLVISRAGSNALYELLALHKPHILIPLSRQASRGDQIQNAAYFADQGFSTVLKEEHLNKETLLSTINETFQQLHAIKTRLSSFKHPDALSLITRLINKATA